MSGRDRFDQVFGIATGGRAPYHWQRELALRNEPARVIVAPTGSGKTEAILLDWLWRRHFHSDPTPQAATPRRLVVALPMRVLVEQTTRRVETALNRLAAGGLLEPPIAVHRLLGGAADDAWVVDPTADVVLVGTIDMLLSRALNRGFGRGRASWPIDFGLLNSDCQWVFDEVQLMDAAAATSCQLEGFRTSFGVAAPVRTVWMSATLEPSWLETIDHPRPRDVSFVTVGDDDRQGLLHARLAAAKVVVRHEADPTQAEGIAKVVLREHEALAHATDAPRLTIALANTVGRAGLLYKTLREEVPADDTDLVLLHSRFRPADRERHVARLSEAMPAGGRIVVSTQVIEAGIDLDAGALVTELAPWASLVQRAGRLNRTGGRTSSPARLVWIDPGEDKLERLRHPYDHELLSRARGALLELDGAGFSPVAIDAYMSAESKRPKMLLGKRPLALLLRRPDLIDLFDTDPTLDGDDPDVGRFIRASEDLDLGVAWRDLPENDPGPDEPTPAQKETCPVPLSERKKIAALSPWRWNYAHRRWERVGGAQDVAPGDLLLIDARRGGYDKEFGWTGESGGRVDPVAHPSDPPDDDAEDPDATYPGRWVSLQKHTTDVVEEVEVLVSSLSLDEAWIAALRRAATVHDVGKAHREFQARLERWGGTPPDPSITYAKAPETTRWRPRRAFRHELVSALVLLEQTGRKRDADLTAYLVAAHHGKVRLTPRVLPDDRDPAVAVCLGVRDGDEVPQVRLNGDTFGPTRLDLSLLRIGSIEETTWIERALDLLESLGPFRLAYLEALLRAADQRASARERQER